jgi:arylsulfatase A-like enzyme
MTASKRYTVHAIAYFLLSLLVVSVTTAEEAARPSQPNILLIVVDDLGWQDVKCYDIDEPSPMETPHMDDLAKQGVLFRQAYSPAPVCSPSRAAILSGIHPARAQHVGVAGGNPPRPHNLKGSRMITPWDRGSLAPQLPNIATALRKEGYTTGHCGKWHLSMSKQGGSQPTDVGFDWSRENHGVQNKMTPHRMTGFATRAEDDPYRLDENGFPRDQNNLDALSFVSENEDKPFFLYYATFLVHTPIHMRSRELLDKYVKKLGVEIPENPQQWVQEGQSNPFYCASVEQLDYYLGQLFSYLNKTDDPRWSGHKLSENTYVILTSDNGGMEGVPEVEKIAENAPLDEGKIHLQEGGVRVPLIIKGPGVKADTDSNVMVNGLDFYPTILSLAGASKETSQKFDGCNLSTLLHKDPTDSNLVRDAGGNIRDTLMWHFPSSVWMESSIRVGDYKLMRNYDHRGGPNSRWRGTLAPPLELYRLYNTESGEAVRVDIEEQNNLVESMPEKARELDQRLTEMLTEMNATYPAFNPYSAAKLPHKAKVPTVVSHKRDGQKVEFTYKEKGASVKSAHLIYTTEGDYLRAEWLKHPAQLQPEHKITATLPPGTTHYFLYLLDENNFLLNYPELPNVVKGEKLNYSDTALKVK